MTPCTRRLGSTSRIKEQDTKCVVRDAESDTSFFNAQQSKRQKKKHDRSDEIRKSCIEIMLDAG